MGAFEGTLLLASGLVIGCMIDGGFVFMMALHANEEMAEQLRREMARQRRKLFESVLDKLPHWPAPLVDGRPAPRCSLQFQGYEPSAWEAEWREKADEYQHKACETMLAQSRLVDTWMEPMNASFSGDAVASQLPAMENQEVFSQFRYLDTCSGKEVRLPMEPLVGLLRHPTAGKYCRRPDRPEFVDVAHDTPRDQKWCLTHPERDCGSAPVNRRTIENKGYMIIQPLPADALAALYPGRKYLFDLGTGRYSSGSLPWFMSIFGAKGVKFDDIYGWELTPIPDQEYWQEWPPHLSHTMHFRNVPCSVEPDDPRNPLNILRRLYEPGDYVAFKLDIDNEPIEQALLSQLDDDTIGMIAEFFTEIHFNITEMREDFKDTGKILLPEVINEMHDFRRRGLRVHYWP